ncbi:MAG: amidohydrolase family protein, partial [Pyrinomonadaceae bacterium]|nr:amidohydrolase family protein [Pyrinomonadaceae bacterium]
MHLRFFVTSVLFIFSAFSASEAFAQQRSILFKNATVIDGSGTARYTADVLITGNRIAKIGKIKASPADEVIDASGLVLAPGFIDIHNHSEDGLEREGTAANQVSQGITTVVVGPDGGSPDDIGKYFAGLSGKIGINVGAFMGHGTLRSLVMKDDLKRESTAAELEAMSKLLEAAMNEGSFGLSSGLEYDAGFSANTDELIALSKIAAKHGGIYMTHMRDEEEGVLNAIREAIRIGSDARIPVQISHIKMGNSSVWGKSKEAIALVDTARKSGQDLTADAYPYTAWASTITVLVPSRKHEDPAAVQKGIDAIGGPDKVLITSCRAFPEYQGKTLKQAAEIAKTDPVNVYIEIVKKGGAGVIGYGMTEEDVKAFYQTPWIMVSSDGGIGSRHPRGTGTFPRVLGRFVRESKWLSLEEAIRKMSGFPAQRL